MDRKRFKNPGNVTDLPANSNAMLADVPGARAPGKHPPSHPAPKSCLNDLEFPKTSANYCHFIEWTVTLKIFKQVNAETMHLNQKGWGEGTRMRYFGVGKRSFLLQRAQWPEKPLISHRQGKKDPKKCFPVPRDPAWADTRLPRHFDEMKEFYRCFKMTILSWGDILLYSSNGTIF